MRLFFSPRKGISPKVIIIIVLRNYHIHDLIIMDLKSNYLIVVELKFGVFDITALNTAFR